MTRLGTNSLKSILILFISLLALRIAALCVDNDMDKFIKELEQRGPCAFLCVYQKGFRIVGIGTAVIENEESTEVVMLAERAAVMNAKTEISEYVKQTISSRKNTAMEFKSALKTSHENGITTEEAKTYSQEKFESEVNVETESLLKNVEVIKTIHIKSKRETITKALVCYTSNSLREKTSAPLAVENASLKDIWLNCKGCGKDRSEAIRAALVEGIQQVYGAYLENDEVYKKRFNAVRTDENIHFKIDTTQTQASLVQSRGFVDEYRIISVEQLENKKYEAIVCAHFLNPRAGGLKAIVVNPMSMPINKETRNYLVSPRMSLSGRSLGRICATQFEKAFTESNKYLVLNQSDLKHAVAEQKATIKLIEDGIVSPMEMTKVGKLLMADYFLNTTFEDISYKKKVVFNPKTNKFEPKEQVSFSFEYTIFDAKTGERVKNNWIMVVLDNASIREIREDTGLREEELGKVLFRTLLRRAVQMLAEDARL